MSSQELGEVVFHFAFFPADPRDKTSYETGHPSARGLASPMLVPFLESPSSVLGSESLLVARLSYTYIKPIGVISATTSTAASETVRYAHATPRAPRRCTEAIFCDTYPNEVYLLRLLLREALMSAPHSLAPSFYRF